MRIGSIGSGRTGGNAGKLFVEPVDIGGWNEVRIVEVSRQGIVPARRGAGDLGGSEAKTRRGGEAWRTRETLLWYYVSKEAKACAAEEHLGLAGGWIPREVLLVLLAAPGSNRSGEPGCSRRFGMADQLPFVGAA